MKILLPIDGVDDAKLIIDFVSKHTWPLHARFKVLHVVGSSETEEGAKHAVNDGERLTGEIAKQVTSFVPGCEVERLVRNGSAIYEIVDEADKWKASMIVMGYRTRPIEKPYLMGSVANGVTVQAPCWVVIVKPAAEPEEREQLDNRATASLDNF